MELLARHRAEDLVAFGRGGERTAGQLWADAHALAGRLPDPELGGDVLVVADDRYHFAVALLACVIAGHAVALPPNAQHQVIRAMADTDAIAGLLHDQSQDVGIDVREHLGEHHAGPAFEPLALAPSRPLAVVHTSGTTGQASAHRKSVGQLVGEAITLAEQLELGAGTKLVATVPPHHIYGLLFSILVPLVGGAAFCRETPLHATAVAAALARDDAGVLVSVPAHLRALLALDRMPRLHAAFSSGAPLPAETGRALRERFGLAVTEVLGSTETGGMAFRRTDGDGAWSPLRGVSLTADEDGRLWVDSPFLAADAPRPYPSPDRVRVLADGRLEHLGRVDDVIKVAGKRVALGEIERHLRALPGVEDVALAAVEVGGARGVEPVGIVVAPGWTPELLRGALMRHLDPVVIPRRLRIVPAIERDERGKLARARLLELYAAAAEPASQLNVESQSTEREGDTEIRRISLTAPRDLTWFRGHFASFPLLPGVVQLELAREHAHRAWGDLGRLGRVLKLKFKRPIRPGERVRLQLRRKGERSRIEFEFEAEGGLASTGVLDFGVRERA